jgi:hypothetical protein
MNPRKREAQRGLALLLVLGVLAFGSLIIVPTLEYGGTALKSLGITRTSRWVSQAVDAVTQQALWEMQYDTKFQDCDTPPDGVVDSFTNCVAKKGSWTITTQALPVGTPYSLIAKVNDQDVSVRVEVPGALSAPPEPTPTPTTGECLFNWVTRDPTWIQIGVPINYTVHVLNCSSSGANKNVRRVVVLLDDSFSFVANSGGGSLPPPTAKQPGTNVLCTGTDAPQPGCKSGLRLLAWPTGTTVWSGGSAVTLTGGEKKTLTFQATASVWGVFYVEARTCFFAASASGCNTEISGTATKEVAPVVVGMFNIQGKGQGYAYGASAKMDGSGSGLISKQ